MFRPILVGKNTPATPPTAARIKHRPNQLLNFTMHASSIVALALGAVAVSATALPNLQVRDGACDPECNFPKSMTCSDNGGATLQKADIVAAARNGDRSGKPYEASASNIASEFCSMTAYRGIPFWTVSFSHKGCVSFSRNLHADFDVYRPTFQAQTARWVRCTMPWHRMAPFTFAARHRAQIHQDGLDDASTTKERGLQAELIIDYPT